MCVKLRGGSLTTGYFLLSGRANGSSSVCNARIQAILELLDWSIFITNVQLVLRPGHRACVLLP